MATKATDTRLAGMLGVARRELGIEVRDAARACGLTQPTLSNVEGGVFRISEGAARRLAHFYLGRLGSPPPHPDLPMLKLVEMMATAIVLRRQSQIVDLLGSLDSGADDLVKAVLLDGLRTERFSLKVARRLRDRLDAEAARARQREEIRAEVLAEMRAGAPA